MPLIQKINNFIKSNNLIRPHTNILVGLSGGPDSVFLLHVLHALAKSYGVTLIAAHLDHQWRENSHDDLIFCQNLSESLGIKFVSEKASEINLAKKFNGSKEELGRNLRRAFFESIAKTHNCHAIALAHHADDQQETFFIRLIRGSSIAGLSCMKPISGNYIRPLLDINKQEILDYLDTNKIAYLKDFTNEQDIYLRNNIRLNILPGIKKADSRFDINFKKTLSNIQEADNFIEKIVIKTFEQITETIDSKLMLDIAKFLNLDPFLQKPIILKWLCAEQVKFTPSDKFFNEIIRYLENKQSKKHQLSQDWNIQKTGNIAFISKSN